jgi:methyl-accepting chemotaxis protein
VESERGVEAVTHNGEVFEKIISDITSLSGEIQQITSVTQELSDSGRVSQNAVGELSEISTKTSRAALYIAAAAREQSSDMIKIADSSRSLLEIAETMQEQVRRFGAAENPAPGTECLPSGPEALKLPEMA